MDLFNDSPSFLALYISFSCLHSRPIGHLPHAHMQPSVQMKTLFSSPHSTECCAAQSFRCERTSQLDPTTLSIQFLNILLCITSSYLSPSTPIPLSLSLSFSNSRFLALSLSLSIFFLSLCVCVGWLPGSLHWRNKQFKTSPPL